MFILCVCVYSSYTFHKYSMLLGYVDATRIVDVFF